MRAELKKLTQKLGMYRIARKILRHTSNRKELKQEKDDYTFYSKFIDDNKLVFDVGGNFGQKSRIFLKLGAKVVAFEPQPQCWKELLYRCGSHKRLTLVKEALGKNTGKATLYIRDHSGASSLKEDWYEPIKDSVEISVTTLDLMIQKYGVPNYIKIDVEGFEYDVLQGLTHPIETVSVEYHIDNKEDIEKVTNCINHLSSMGNIQLNITPAEETKFYYDQWLSKEEFMKKFPKDFVEKKGFNYGDVYIRSEMQRSS